MDYKKETRFFLISAGAFVLYVCGTAALACFQGLAWDAAPVFWVGIQDAPLWIKLVSGLTVIAGTALIYFIPGIFIAQPANRDSEDPITVGLQGFLINYFFYYGFSTLYKMFGGREFSRGSMVILIAAGIVTTWIFLRFKTKAFATAPKDRGKSFFSKHFILLYLIFWTCLFFVFWEKIFFAHFDGDGAEQYWLAHSVKTGILPTGYRSPFTLVPQFVFSPSIYLNMFALALFGSAEFIVRIEILMAFLWIGFVLKGLIEQLRCGKKLEGHELTVFFLYLLIFFTIASHRSSYYSPTDLAKSNETFQLALFLSGFYLLVRYPKGKDALAALCFVFAAMVRYNGLFMITFFLAGFSLLFKRYRCFLGYLTGLSFALLALHLLLIPSDYKFQHMIGELLSDGKSLRAQGFDLGFLLGYLRNYFVFTAGLSIFLLINLKNRYVLLMGLTTVFFLILPSWSDCVPAHYFAPIIMFPLMSYLSWK